uniref:Uncharacterized protein n=1 Tax=Stomoxys calcitrans TaxID=35570 RepID=A0A1I8P8J0_STOCA
MVGGGGNNKIVATLRADCKVYPTNQGSASLDHQLANLMNYKIRTEGEVSNKSLNTLSVPTTVVDLGKQLLQYARDSDVKGVKNALFRGAPFTSDWLGMSALHFAAMNNQYEICQVLLNGGINKDSKTKVDRTPLHLACYYGNEQIVELLLSKGCAVNPKDMLRMTPLHWAVERRHKSIVRMLLKHNADVTVITKFGRTPLAIAVLTEQADLLEDLENARQAQANRTFNEQHETILKHRKETSEAVNSIMGLTNAAAGEENGNAAKSREPEDDEFMSQSEYAASKIEDLENIKETGIIGDSTLNLLKSHGISMMPEDDTSKDMLNTALQNGRQLVLSEGGKLLLNETKKIQNSNSNLSNSVSKNLLPRVRNDAYVSSSNTNTNMSKLKPNIISKAKDNQQQQMAKNKNIRIISLNDFKKLYGNTNLKSMQKIPPSVTSQQRVVNVRQPMQLRQQQIKVDLKNDNNNKHSATQDNAAVVLEEDILPHIIQIASKDENDVADTEMPKQQTLVRTIQPHSAITKQSVRIVPAKRVEHLGGAVPVRQVNAAKTIKLAPSRTTVLQDTKPTAAGSSPVVPLLTTTEICRQLLLMKQQNEELRRKFDLAQKEKEEMRQRIDRLEELLLVEKTDDDFTN